MSIHLCCRYTRNLVAEGNGKFNLMILCWNESQGSSIHDHTSAHCFVKVLQGSLTETMFAWPSESLEEHQLTETAVNHYPTDGVTYICGKLLYNPDLASSADFST